ncbi:DUF721 domain-containing protein [Mesonia sp. K7]|uniref:DUF721 domain-containing protein n=1 Tax=Mesonia sp. K7 TaxID=2218606 RepID=UPI000DA7DF6D|nr:DUF721 domain-containing protein [Mesonia sp. K7]PZD78294.1 DUF721 domain-containing protein [Mesonia sp. K7]
MARNSEEQNVGNVLKDFIEKNKLDKGLDIVQLQEVWNTQMGPAIRKYTTQIQFKNETLYVSLSSSVLREELSYGKTRIIQMLNEEMGREIVKKLVLR